MAIVLDRQAQSAVSRRRAAGHESRILLQVDRLRGRAGAFAHAPEVLLVRWLPHRWPERTLIACTTGNTTTYMDTRIARYTECNDLIVSAWHMGPIDHLTLDPLAILSMEDWEVEHLEPGSQPVPPVISLAQRRASRC